MLLQTGEPHAAPPDGTNRGGKGANAPAEPELLSSQHQDSSSQGKQGFGFVCCFLLSPPWAGWLAPRSPDKPSVARQLRLTRLTTTAFRVCWVSAASPAQGAQPGCHRDRHSLAGISWCPVSHSPPQQGRQRSGTRAL